jgi:hypothetical protein
MADRQRGDVISILSLLQKKKIRIKMDSLSLSGTLGTATALSEMSSRIYQTSRHYVQETVILIIILI